MRLTPRCVPGWPKLAWVAVCRDGSEDVVVRHGPLVEVREEWIAEAVWAGAFAEGDFDRTDLVVGTGIRNRGDHVVFVSSGTAVDRLWHGEHGDCRYVANTLPGLLAVAGWSLDEDYLDYRGDLETIDDPGGLRKYVRQIPGCETVLHLVYFDNLRYDGRRLEQIEKPDSAPSFHRYEQYFSYLADAARQLGVNGRAPERRAPVACAATISSGYDSTAAAVLARYAGCELAVTIRNPTSLWRGSDSGQAVAERLGMPCRAYRHRPRCYQFEEAVWAAVGRPRGLNLTIFELPEPLCLLFTGNFGDKIWDRHYIYGLDTGDLEGVALSEFRLFRGIFDGVPAWWGFRHAEEIKRINLSAEMAPWTLNTNYDRPIARRIIEEAGVSRGSFAVRKKNTSSEAEFRWPYGREARRRFAEYLRRRGVYAPPTCLISPLRKLVHVDRFLHVNLLRRLGVQARLKDWLMLKGSALVFHWANLELKRMYEAGLRGAQSDGRQSAARSADQPVNRGMEP